VSPWGVDGRFVAAVLATVSVVAALEGLLVEVDVEVPPDGGLEDVVLR
jgi:hypothetical protein